MYLSRSMSRFTWSLGHRWSRVRLVWSVADKEPWIFGLVLGLVVATFAIVLVSFFAYKDERQREIAANQDDRRNLTCLARNVYFEARGEPMKGQHAVAEVTMNRVASGIYPASVCDVVYQKNWDVIRKRYVGAFSWTEFNSLPNPTGEAWQQAWKVAEAVYYGTEPLVVEGALHFHATYIKPDWAAQRKQLARIGKHVFYN
jgi:spore germination cell wall hydrolase CwlJ-like protein